MLSFVIPVLNEAHRLPGLLSELRERFPDAELIVVDGGSTDASVSVALGNADVVLMGEAGRASQMNLGAEGAAGDYLCFLHADTMPKFVSPDVAAVLGEDEAWTFCRVALEGESRGLPMVAFFMNLRSRLTSVATGDQLLIVSRALFRQIGGFADMPLMEDVEICKRLRRIQKPLRHRLMVRSSGRRWDQQGLLRTILRMWALRLAYWLGVSPKKLWAHYYGKQALRPVPGHGAQP